MRAFGQSLQQGSAALLQLGVCCDGLSAGAFSEPLQRGSAAMPAAVSPAKPNKSFCARTVGHIATLPLAMSCYAGCHAGRSWGRPNCPCGGAAVVQRFSSHREVSFRPVSSGRTPTWAERLHRMNLALWICQGPLAAVLPASSSAKISMSKPRLLASAQTRVAPFPVPVIWLTAACELGFAASGKHWCPAPCRHRAPALRTS